MNKALLLEEIVSALEAIYKGSVDAAMQASDTATDKESVAENKYDTFGLEASYLAHGQTERMLECEANLAAFNKLVPAVFTETMPIAIGALITLEDKLGSEQVLFLGPAAGGLKVCCEEKDIMLITRSAPLGAALFGRFKGDEVEIDLGGKKKWYEITCVD